MPARLSRTSLAPPLADGYSASMTLGLKLRHKIETTQHQGKANEAA